MLVCTDGERHLSASCSSMTKSRAASRRTTVELSRSPCLPEPDVGSIHIQDAVTESVAVALTPDEIRCAPIRSDCLRQAWYSSDRWNAQYLAASIFFLINSPFARPSSKARRWALHKARPRRFRPLAAGRTIWPPRTRRSQGGQCNPMPRVRPDSTALTMTS
jgi:hypothetical protein